jgi:formylglycine-generating enzyme required for sulfatase activity
MVVVPAGAFFMGCDPARDATCRFDELPGRMVELSGFAIDRQEVTQADWAACMAATICAAPDAHFSPLTTPDAPVRDVVWAEADAYCAWRGKRLPSEAQWEKAARGDDARTYPWGETPPTCVLALFDACAGEPEVGTHPAGRSSSGAEDMAGGVWEWVADRYGSGYDGLPAEEPLGPSEGANRVIRGGSYRSSAWTMRASTRAAADPGVAYDDVGFRCARPSS